MIVFPKQTLNACMSVYLKYLVYYELWIIVLTPSKFCRKNVHTPSSFQGNNKTVLKFSVSLDVTRTHKHIHPPNSFWGLLAVKQRICEKASEYTHPTSELLGHVPPEAWSRALCHSSSITSSPIAPPPSPPHPLLLHQTSLGLSLALDVHEPGHPLVLIVSAHRPKPQLGEEDGWAAEKPGASPQIHSVLRLTDDLWCYKGLAVCNIKLQRGRKKKKHVNLSRVVWKICA